MFNHKVPKSDVIHATFIVTEEFNIVTKIFWVCVSWISPLNGEGCLYFNIEHGWN